MKWCNYSKIIIKELNRSKIYSLKYAKIYKLIVNSSFTVSEYYIICTYYIKIKENKYINIMNMLSSDFIIYIITYQNIIITMN